MGMRLGPCTFFLIIAMSALWVGSRTHCISHALTNDLIATWEGKWCPSCEYVQEIFALKNEGVNMEVQALCGYKLIDN